MVENSNRRAGRERDTGQPFDLGFEPVQPAVLDRVFQSRVPPIRAVAMVPLSNKNRPSDRIDLIGCDETENIRKPGKGFRRFRGSCPCHHPQ